MARPFKIFLYCVGGFFALVVLAAIALPLIFNPNDYKDEAAVAAKDATGRELKINGDIELSLFPWLGAKVADVSLANAEGFGPEPFARIARVDLRVRLKPLLFDKRVEVGKILVDGLALNLQKDASGKNNWSDLADHKGETKKEEPAPAEGKPLAFSIGGIDISNASFHYTDKQTGAAYKVDQLSIETGPVELGKPLDVAIAFLVNSAQPPLESEVKLVFTALADTDKKVYELKDLKLDSTTKGASVPGGSQKASVRAGVRYDGAAGTLAMSDAVLEAAGLKVNATLNGQNLAGDALKLTGKLASNIFNPKDVARSFGIELPPTADASALTSASFAADIGGDNQNARLEKLQLKLDQTTAAGSLAIVNFADPLITFALKADRFDADRYLAPESKDKAAESGASNRDFKNTQLPVEALDKVNAKGTIELASLKLKNLQMSNIRVTLDAPKGKVKTEEMTATLYGGQVKQTARITPAGGASAKPKYDLTMGLNGVNSAPLQNDLIGKNYLSGLASFTLNVSSGGATVGDVLRALSGAVATNLKDGAVEGFNLDATLASAKALYGGQPLPPSGAPQRTEFRDLKGSGKIENGVLDTDTLNVQGSWYQLGGDGKVDLFEQTVNYVLYPTVTGGSDKYKELQGTKIPVSVTGTWADPKIKVELEDVLKGRVKQELKQQEDKLKEKATEKLGDFFRKKLGPQPAPAPTETPPAEPAQTPQ
ncbi:MAG TPA: AsmA family protein [Verrucomicrobiae bacterium]|nr:AsmA family protein [Verrucomicrobiae bacterium]